MDNNRIKTYEGFKDWFNKLRGNGKDNNESEVVQQEQPEYRNQPQAIKRSASTESSERTSNDGIPRNVKDLRIMLNNIKRDEYKKFDFIVNQKFDIEKYLNHIDSWTEKSELGAFIVDYYNKLNSSGPRPENANTKYGYGYIDSPFVKDPDINVESIMKQINERKRSKK